jgi:hypothetical protein
MKPSLELARSLTDPYAQRLIDGDLLVEPFANLIFATRLMLDVLEKVAPDEDAPDGWVPYDPEAVAIPASNFAALGLDVAL